MALTEFSLRLQHGIAGGFAPPTPSAIYTITKANTNNTLLIASAIREEGTADIQEAAPRSLSFESGDTKRLISELHGILKELPTEQPPGSEDIYGLDTSIAWGSDDLEWINGGPEGCGGGHSMVQVTAEQKAQFGRAVEIVAEVVSGDVTID